MAEFVDELNEMCKAGCEKCCNEKCKEAQKAESQQLSNSNACSV
jgi:hypothetical protein